MFSPSRPSLKTKVQSPASQQVCIEHLLSVLSPATWSAHIFQWGKRNTKGRTAAPSAGNTYNVQEWNAEGVKSDGAGGVREVLASLWSSRKARDSSVEI